MATFLDPENGYLGALTFDLGSDLIRAGFAGDDMPRALYPSTACFAGSEGNDEPLVLTDGDTHLADATVAGLFARPLRRAHGEPVDDEVLKALLSHGLRRLGETSWTEHPLLLSEPTGSSAASRRQTAELVFEDLQAPALCVAHAAELICVSAGRPTSTVLELNDDAATASVVVDGALQARSVTSSAQLGGQNLAHKFSQLASPYTGIVTPSCLLRTTNLECNPSYTEYRLTDLKREMCDALCRCVDVAPKAVAKGGGRSRGGGRASIGTTAEPAPTEPSIYTLPDGRKISVPDSEGTQACEVLFNAARGGGGEVKAEATNLPAPTLQNIVVTAMERMEADYHKELLRSVVVTGNIACLPGVPERLEHEVFVAAQNSKRESIKHQHHRLTIFIGTPRERRDGAWLGGSILGSLGSHHDLWMSKAEYEEYGAPLISRKAMQHAW